MVACELALQDILSGTPAGIGLGPSSVASAPAMGSGLSVGMGREAGSLTDAADRYVLTCSREDVAAQGNICLNPGLLSARFSYDAK